jgi:hypothetical protein
MHGSIVAFRGPEVRHLPNQVNESLARERRREACIITLAIFPMASGAGSLELNLARIWVGVHTKGRLSQAIRLFLVGEAKRGTHYDDDSRYD